ncbi:MAG TPA: cytochrome d ubiquinol oxidase subunit II [Streptosporangiaceae bacterium]
MIADAVAAILLASITLYATLGGADFGAGLWDLLGGGDTRGRYPRQLIDESITPVWEANHVWLIFALVIFWTGFPIAFAAVMTAAALPIWLAVLGIVLRGSGFAFRKEAQGLRMQRFLGAVFAFSSLLTPFFMGTVIGGIAAGRISATATHATLSVWTGPLSLLTGFLFVSACAYLAAAYLTVEAVRRNDQRLQIYFTRRAQAAGVVTGALSLATLAELHSAALALFRPLTGRALPLVVVAGVSGLALLVLLTIGRVGPPVVTRFLAALAVAAVVWGWGVAQYPVLLPGTGVTLTNAGAPHATLVAIVVLFAALAVIVGPSFVLLFSLHGRMVLQGGGEMALAGAGGGGGSGGGGGAGGSGGSAGAAGRPRGSSGRARSASRAVALGLVALGILVRGRTRRRPGR